MLTICFYFFNFRNHKIDFRNEIIQKLKEILMPGLRHCKGKIFSFKNSALNASQTQYVLYNLPFYFRDENVMGGHTRLMLINRSSSLLVQKGSLY